ncbi:MAG: response regulator [Euryarchaeota archaeon]|nr:response regulator [Euryarchaeota archaeon]
MKKIMSVDDDPDQTFTVKQRLERLGDYQVIPIDGGKKCLEWLQNKGLPDLILLDVMMPEMNGWEVFKAIRQNQNWKKIPIVFLTARTDAFSKGFGKILGDAYIEKPFDMNDLKEKIERILATPYEISDTKAKIIEDMIEKAIR